MNPDRNEKFGQELEDPRLPDYYTTRLQREGENINTSRNSFRNAALIVISVALAGGGVSAAVILSGQSKKEVPAEIAAPSSSAQRPVKKKIPEKAEKKELVITCTIDIEADSFQEYMEKIKNSRALYNAIMAAVEKSSAEMLYGGQIEDKVLHELKKKVFDNFLEHLASNDDNPIAKQVSSAYGRHFNYFKEHGEWRPEADQTKKFYDSIDIDCGVK